MPLSCHKRPSSHAEVRTAPAIAAQSGEQRSDLGSSWLNLRVATAVRGPIEGESTFAARFAARRTPPDAKVRIEPSGFEPKEDRDMKKLLALIVVLYATAALAQQDDEPPPAPQKPPAHAKSKAQPKGPPKSLAEKLLACLDIDDESKERLDCYDAVIPPKPKPRASPANGVMDCRYVKEEDERLKCFNGFAEKIPKFSSR
jgi:hypothetical protein